MITRYLATYVAMIGATLALCAVILLANVGKIGPIDGAVLITTVDLCDDAACTSAAPVSLPYFSPKGPDAALRTLHFRAAVDLVRHPDGIQGIYVPRFADHLGVTLNAETLRAVETDRRQWTEPVLIDVPDSLFLSGQNQIALTVVGRPTEGIELHPFFVGPRDVLRPAFVARSTMGPGFARVNLVFIVILGAVYAIVWCLHRQDHRYLFLGLSCLSACVILLHFGYGVVWGGYKIWTGLMHLAIASYALFITKFLRIHLGLEKLKTELFLLCGIAVAAVALIFVTADQMQIWTMMINAFTAVASVAVLTVFWIHRRNLERLDFYVIFACILSATALGAHEFYLVHSADPGQSFHMFHFVPVTLSLVCLWVIVSQLTRSLRRYANLTTHLSETIAAKTRELEQSFARLAAVERREAVDRERNRIMLDLHDGIGGQLVSTLAYMESTGQDDPTLKAALEAALRDLALVLDSLDSHDSLTTLLGMLRTRLEPLLTDHGLAFDWHITDDPVVPHAGPSTNLHLARIVQEAITNVIKHARASTITVYTDARTIMIVDDGVGFDPKQHDLETCSGHGLAGMRHRAKMIGTAFEITSTPEGTRIRLCFDPVAPA